EISAALHAEDHSKAKELTDSLKKKYEGVIKELYKTDGAYTKGKELIESHFNYIHSFNNNPFGIKEERAILAQGELLSTAMFHYYLEEIKIPSVLLAALNFMRIDENEEPDMKHIDAAVASELAKHKGSKLFITQGYICRDAVGE